MTSSDTMLRFTRTLFCALIAFSVVESVVAARGFGGRRIGGGHSYPKSGGLSGGGHGYPSSGSSHGYPSSGGLSGGSHGYPSSGGLSGNSHGYPSSGGLSGGSSHGYPASSGTNHGYPASSGTSHGYPATSGTNHGYPGSGGLSGTGQGYPSNTHHPSSHGYPAGKGLSGNTASGGGTTIIHNNYNYNPPQQIKYTPVHGGSPVSYPVYHGTPPTSVYKYKDSGSKYGTLLTGLALMNLGVLAGGIYGHSQSHSSSSYKPQAGEICKFGIKKDNGDYEETKIDCHLISNFILQEQAKTQNASSNTTVITTTVTNVTMVNSTLPETAPESSSVKPNPIYEMLPNGTLVPVNITVQNDNTTSANTTSETNNSTAPANGTVASSVIVTTTTTNTTVTDALDVKGKPIAVTPGMNCFILRHTPTSNMKKTVPCGVLQSYADQSIQKKNSASRITPVFTVLTGFLVLFVIN